MENSLFELLDLLPVMCGSKWAITCSFESVVKTVRLEILASGVSAEKAACCPSLIVAPGYCLSPKAA